ncbi:MAG TPA: DNA adenine methylase [Patescibacteria group bacterium]|nr:DNA adenine methylase [Patescibacteria group bacterium]
MASAEPLALPRPFLKWAGGKTQLLDQFAGLYPEAGSFKRYIEPFVGSGAVFFQIKALLNPPSSILMDGNEELINVYRAVKDDVEGLIGKLRKHKAAHCRSHYYEVRAQRGARLTETARAARLIYLNKTCYNGLYRVNSRGEFNVPIGAYTDPAILNEENLRLASAALRRVRLEVADFTRVLSIARGGDFIYFDPPYHPVSETAYFTSYTEKSFKTEDQRRLADLYRALDEKGCLLMLSNSETPLVRDLYQDRYHVQIVSARRNINSRADKRGRIPELVVTNYTPAGRPERVSIQPARSATTARRSKNLRLNG